MMRFSEIFAADPKAACRMVRRKRRGMNVAFRRPTDGKLDCFSFTTLEQAERFAAAKNGRLV